jgi:signal transduction histidine kinase
MTRFFSLILLLLFVGKSTSAQTNNYFLYAHYNSQNGLPQNSVRDFYVSSSGFLWIATEDGLVRFDGKNCKIFDEKNAPLKESRISQLINTYDGKLYCITPHCWVHEITEDQVNISIKCVTKLLNKGFTDYHLFTGENLSHFIAMRSKARNTRYYNTHQYAMLYLKDSSYSIIRVKGGLQVFSREMKLMKYLSVPQEEAVEYFVQNGHLYFYDKRQHISEVNITTGKITALKAESGSVLSTYAGIASPVNHFFWDKRTLDLFFTIDGVLYRVSINEAKKKVSTEKMISGLPRFECSKISYLPESQTILLGTTSNGFYVYRKRQFSNILSKDPVVNNVFYAQASMYHKNAVLTKDNQLLGPTQQQTIRPLVSGYNDKNMCVDDKYNIWLANGDTLKCYDPAKGKVVVKGIIGIQHDRIFFVAKNDNASFLVMTAKYLYYYKVDSGFVQLGCFNFPRPDNIQEQPCMLKISGTDWLLGTYAGLYRYQAKSRKLQPDKRLQLVSIRCLYKTSTGLILIGTYGNGLYALKDNQLLTLPRDLFNNLKAVHCFMEDKKGNIWMSSNNGLYRISRAAIEQYSSDTTKSLYYYRFSDADGLPTNEFNGGCYPCAVAINDHTWSFPSMQGLIWFNPDSVEATISTSPVFIDEIQLAGHESLQLDPNKLLRLPHHQFKLAFFISTSNWGDEKNLAIDYKLVGNDQSDEWIPVKNINEPVIIQNLPGGTYRFIVRKRTGFGEKDYKEIQVGIDVPLLLQERRWFVPALILLTLLMITAFSRLYTYYLRRKKARLEQLVSRRTHELKDAVTILQEQNILIKESEVKLKEESELKTTLLFILSHEIASPLRFINLYLNGIYNSKRQGGLSEEDLDDLRMSASNLQHLLDNLVAWLQSLHDKNMSPVLSVVDLHGIAQDKINLFAVTANKKGIQLINDISPDVLLLTDASIMAIALQNLIGNAVYHTGKGEVRVQFTTNKDHYEILVKNSNVIGIHENENLLQEDMWPSPVAEQIKELKGYGIGLKITRQLLQLIDGALLIQINESGAEAILKMVRHPA